MGITDFAQNQLGDIVFVELPAVGRTIAKGETAAVVESGKIASDIFAPITGEIVAIDEMVAADPSLLNSEAEQGGWLFKVTISDPTELTELMDQQTYSELDCLRTGKNMPSAPYDALDCFVFMRRHIDCR